MKTITIMPDFGNGPYAWIRDGESESEGVGLNIADAVGGFGGQYDVPAALDDQFASRVTRFERGCDDPAFDWPAFRQEALALATSLKRAVGDAYRVIYRKPHEDSDFRVGTATEIG